jgi:elongation factor 1-gamma
MTFGKVYAYGDNPRLRALQVTAKYQGLDLEVVQTNPWTKEGVTEDFLKKFPLGKVG